MPREGEGEVVVGNVHVNIKILPLSLSLSPLQRLSCYNITVSELTGDHQLTKEQIAATQVLVKRAYKTCQTGFIRL